MDWNTSSTRRNHICSSPSIGGEKVKGKDKMKGNGIGSMDKDRHSGKNGHNDEGYI